MTGRRVVITGLGVISSLGRNRQEFWEALAAGRSGISQITAVDCRHLRLTQGAEVQDFNPLDHFLPKQADLLDRFVQFALVAAREAVAEADLEGRAEMLARTAIITGSGLGGTITEDHEYSEFYGKGRFRVHPMTILRSMPNAGASKISMEFGITGPAFTLNTACSSSAHAIGLAFWLIRTGQVEMAIAGGSEAPFTLGNLKAWEAMRVVAPDTCRPFSGERRGMILGEGGAMLVLEPLEAALGRGARIWGEIIGFGMSADAHHWTEPLADGAVLAMRQALADAGITPEQIGYINAHGTGTAVNDKTEVAAIRAFFGRHAERLAISSTKSAHGHTLGAAGAMESIATILALYHGLLPATLNFTEPDPDCALDIIPNIPRPLAVNCALSNSFAFGGLNAVLVFRRWPDG
jgi:nodulation protein E